MKKSILFISLVCLSIPGYSTIHTITNTGIAFNPASITINQGDTIVFELTSEHDAHEVSQDTWNANSSVSLAGGFQVPLGGGMVLPAQLTEGVHYYVCSPHASLGMKGTITVQSSTNTDEILHSTLYVYPNPASEYVRVKNNQASTKFIITDITGRVMLTGVLADENSSVGISSLPSGLYFLLLGGKKDYRVKFLKK